MSGLPSPFETPAEWEDLQECVECGDLTPEWDDEYNVPLHEDCRDSWIATRHYDDADVRREEE